MAVCYGGYCLPPGATPEQAAELAERVAADKTVPLQAGVPAFPQARPSAPPDRAAPPMPFDPGGALPAYAAGPIRFERSAHPFVKAPDLPAEEALEPQVRLLFQVADLQADKLIAPAGQHVRRVEFHNSVDPLGNTFSSASSSFSVSFPLALTSLAIILLASSIGLSFLLRTPGPVPQAFRPVDPLSDATFPLAPEALPSSSDSDLVHVIEWEEPSLADRQYTWADVLHASSGDVMAAAAAIKDELASDPGLDPASPEAFKRAVHALSLHQPAVQA